MARDITNAARVRRLPSQPSRRRYSGQPEEHNTTAQSSAERNGRSTRRQPASSSSRTAQPNVRSRVEFNGDDFMVFTSALTALKIFLCVGINSVAPADGCHRVQSESSNNPQDYLIKPNPISAGRRFNKFRAAAFSAAERSWVAASV